MKTNADIAAELTQAALLRASNKVLLDRIADLQREVTCLRIALRQPEALQALVDGLMGSPERP